MRLFRFRYASTATEAAGRVLHSCAKLLRKCSFFPEDHVNPEQRGAFEPKLYRFDHFCLNPLERRLTFDEVTVAIPPKALDALILSQTPVV